MKIFTVRGRPVGFQPGRFGGALVAVERGFFPISSTGYRSLSGALAGADEATADVPSALLESLAANQDTARAQVLARVQRAPRLERDPLSNYLGASGDAEQALAEGFFAPDAERVALWGGAYRRFCLIDADPRFQPVNSAPAWRPDQCARALAAQRSLLDLVRRLAAGDWPTVTPLRPFGLATYFELPLKSRGEPTFALPSIATEFALHLPTLPPEADDDDPDDEHEEQREHERDQQHVRASHDARDGEQLALF